MGEYKFKQIVLRMKLTTYRRIRKSFKAYRNESVSEYFERLSKELELGVILR